MCNHNNKQASHPVSWTGNSLNHSVWFGNQQIVTESTELASIEVCFFFSVLSSLRYTVYCVCECTRHTHTHTNTHWHTHTRTHATHLYALKQTYGKGHMDSKRTNIWEKSCSSKQTYKHRHDDTHTHMWVHAHTFSHIPAHERPPKASVLVTRRKLCLNICWNRQNMSRFRNHIHTHTHTHYTPPN